MNNELNPQEVVEVKISWGNHLLLITHLKHKEQRFYLSPDASDIPKNNRFVVGAEIIESLTDIPVLKNNTVFFLPNAQSEIEYQGNIRALSELSLRPSLEVPGGHEASLYKGAIFRQIIKHGIKVEIQLVQPERVIPLANPIKDRGMLTSFGITLCMMLLFLGMMGYAVVLDASPWLSSTTNEDRLAELRSFVLRNHERQEALPERREEISTEATELNQPERATGRTSPRVSRAPRQERRFQTQVSVRERLQGNGIFRALGSAGGLMQGGSSSGIVSPFGEMTDENIGVNMPTDNIGDAFGYGVLTGWGGGREVEGTINGGPVNTVGGRGERETYGRLQGSSLANRRTAGPVVRPHRPEITGLLSPEAIRRVVLRNIGQINYCYEQGLASNPSLTGRVVVRFVIGGTGTVMGAAVSESSISNEVVNSCIAQAARRWQFPAPEGAGVVTVNYPFNLQTTSD